MPTRDEVLQALSRVMDPELGRDIVSLGMVQDVQVDGGRVAVRIVLTTPACPLRDHIQEDVRRALQALPGVQEVDITMDAQVPQGIRALDLPHIRTAIAVGSGKGGVGKSTVAVNLAVALADLGASVGLLDADIYGPNIPRMMGVHRLPPLTEEGKLRPAEAYGVKLMSIGFLVPPDQPLIWRGPMLHTAIRQFLHDVDWGQLDYLIIDLPPGTGDAALSVAQLLPLTGAVVVTLPQKVSLDDARRSVEMFRKLNVPVLGIIENMSYLELPDGTRMDVFGAGGGEALAQEVDAPYLGAIPMDPEVRKGGDAGKPVVVTQPEAPVSKALLELAKQVAARISVQAVTQPRETPSGAGGRIPLIRGPRIGR